MKECTDEVSNVVNPFRFITRRDHSKSFSLGRQTTLRQTFSFAPLRSFTLRRSVERSWVVHNPASSSTPRQRLALRKEAA
jgi:hypothetical protein